MKEQEFVDDFSKKFRELFPDSQMVIGVTSGDNFVFTNWYVKTFGALFWMTEIIRDACKKASLKKGEESK